MIKSFPSKLLVLPLALAVACAADSREDGDLVDVDSEEGPAPGEGIQVNGDVTLLAEASRGSRTVQFYEIEPGHLLEVEHGNASEVAQEAAEPEDLNSVQRYAFLTGHEPPIALAAAQKRANRGALKSDEGHYSPYVSEEGTFGAAGTDHTKGGTSPQPAQSQAWFRANYCTATDRTYFLFARTAPVDWRGTGINYRKNGVFCSVGQVSVLLQYYISGLFPETRSLFGWLAPGWYMASRETSAKDAVVVDTVANVESGDRFDFCTNFHY